MPHNFHFASLKITKQIPQKHFVIQGGRIISFVDYYSLKTANQKMIQLRSMLKVADNSGAKIIQCINVLGGTRKRYAQLGDIIVCAVKEAEPRKLVKKHEIVKAVIVRQKKEFRRPDGSYIRFDDNAAVILGDDKMPKAGRVFGPIAREVKEKGFDTIAQMASELL